MIVLSLDSLIVLLMICEEVAEEDAKRDDICLLRASKRQFPCFSFLRADKEGHGTDRVVYALQVVVPGKASTICGRRVPMKAAGLRWTFKKARSDN
uniref:Secreted protein n=1 Tax=Steinernema glaseri TaxID=37863 RepID=A0A1I7Y8P7_9BILA